MAEEYGGSLVQWELRELYMERGGGGGKREEKKGREGKIAKIRVLLHLAINYYSKPTYHTEHMKCVQGGNAYQTVDPRHSHNKIILIYTLDGCPQFHK